MRGCLPIIALASFLILGNPILAQEKATPDEALLEKEGLKSDAESLLTFFHKRTLAENRRDHLQDLIRKLGSPRFPERDRATRDLIEFGPGAIEILRKALAEAADLESSRRLEHCLDAIVKGDVPTGVATAAVRVLAKRKPDAAVETLFAYLPFADNEGVVDEIRAALGELGLAAGKGHPLLVAGLTDKAPIKRAVAGEVLWRFGPGDLKPALRNLFKDADPQVRYRIAHAALLSKDAEGGPFLIEALADLPHHLAWQAEEVLLRLAEGKEAPQVSLGSDATARKKCRDAWHVWWKERGTKVDLAQLGETPKLKGHTIVVLLDLGSIVELGPDNAQIWKIDGLMFPLDVQYLDDTKILVAEYHARRITERRVSDGQITWYKSFDDGPLVAQRLPNGHTFVATDQTLFEFDKSGKEIVKIVLDGDEAKRIMKAMKLPNGEVVVLRSDSRVVRLDAKGQELASFELSLGTRLFGGRIQMLPSGRVLVPHNAEDKVVEYDSRGKPIWEVAVEKPVAAIRLPNGHTLVTSMNHTVGAVEFNRAGQEVWSYRTTTRVTRALRR